MESNVIPSFCYPVPTRQTLVSNDVTSASWQQLSIIILASFLHNRRKSKHNYFPSSASLRTFCSFPEPVLASLCMLSAH